MNYLKQKYELLTNAYTPNEFLPIKYDGELQNRTEFIAYKVRKVLHGQLY